MTENLNIRLSKIIASSGLCSRRQAEKFISEGRVKVLQKIITEMGFKCDPDDDITVDNKPLRPQPKVRLWRYFKPRSVMTTHHDPEGRRTILDDLPQAHHWISVGRLDYNTEGLLLLTNDGHLARFLEHPSQGWERVYRVRVHGMITPEKILKMTQGIQIDGHKYKPIDCIIEKQQKSNTWLKMILREGKNREIRRICEALELQVTRLIRISYGPFELGNLNEKDCVEVPYYKVKSFLETSKYENNRR